MRQQRNASAMKNVGKQLWMIKNNESESRKVQIGRKLRTKLSTEEKKKSRQKERARR